nr:YaeQ family protein [Reinekea sp. G2M2-21]
MHQIPGSISVALKPVIYKLNLNLSDLNRQHYQDYHLTIALHPSETLERMVARLMAFALNASDNLTLTKGLSTVEEPDLWAKSLDDQISLWIELGEPSVERVKKASRMAQQVKVYSFNSKSDVWWQQESGKFKRLEADFIQFNYDEISNLAALVARTMKWFVTINDSSASVHTEQGEVDINWSLLHSQAQQ